MRWTPAPTVSAYWVKNPKPWQRHLGVQVEDTVGRSWQDRSNSDLFHHLIWGCFLKWWVSPTTIGFPTKIWSFWGVPPFKETRICIECVSIAIVCMSPYLSIHLSVCMDVCNQLFTWPSPQLAVLESNETCCARAVTSLASSLRHTSSNDRNATNAMSSAFAARSAVSHWVAAYTTPRMFVKHPTGHHKPIGFCSMI